MLTTDQYHVHDESIDDVNNLDKYSCSHKYCCGGNIKKNYDFSTYDNIWA